MAKKNTKTEREESEGLRCAVDARLIDLNAKLETFRMDWGNCGLIALLNRIEEKIECFHSDLNCV